MKKTINKKRLLIFSSMLVAGAFALGGCAAQAQAEADARDYFNIPAGLQTATFVGQETEVAVINPTESKAENYTLTVVDENGDEVSVVRNKFTPAKAGEYKCYYTYELFGEVYQYDYTITASVKDGPVFNKAPQFPYAFMANREYTLPQLTATDYSQNGAAATVKVSVAGVEENDYAFTPAYNGVGTETEITYTATVGAKMETLTVKVPVLNPFINDEEVDITDIFVSTAFESKKLTDEAIVYTATKDATLQYANFFYADNTPINFGFGANDGAKAITVTYTSYEDPSVAVKLRYEKGNLSLGTGKAILNDSLSVSYEYEPNQQLSIQYNGKRNTLVGAGGVELFTVTTDTLGRPFNGFPGDLVKVSFDVEDVYGVCDICIYKIGSQMLGGVDSDLIAPTVNRIATPMEYKVGDVVTIPGAYVLDVIDPYTTIKVTVKYNGQVVEDINGRRLQNVDGKKAISFVVEKSGQYSMTSQVMDGAGNPNLMPITNNFYVYDYNPPVISVSGSLPTSVKVGDKITIPTITATDAENGSKITLQICVIRDTMHMTQIAVDDDNRNDCSITGATYTFTKAGTYTIRIIATDDSANYARQEYTIVCGE